LITTAFTPQKPTIFLQHHQQGCTKKLNVKDMKKILLVIAVWFTTIGAHAQNVGIGTNSPMKKLSVNGSLLID
jgi:hypothetical protein